MSEDASGIVVEKQLAEIGRDVAALDIHLAAFRAAKQAISCFFAAAPR